jgi:TrmH family RNA methyltransferase
MNWYVILVGNEFAGNAGQIARTMGNFDFDKLVLVHPLWDDPMPGFVYAHTPEGLEIFDRRMTFKSLEEAISKLKLNTTIAFTRRSGKVRQINYDHRKYFSKFFDSTYMDINKENINIGLVFGREKTGLTAQEIENCSILVYIPTSKKSPSLNLAQSVAIILETIFNEKNSREQNLDNLNNLIRPQIHTASTEIEREEFYKEIINAAKKRKLFIKNDEKSFRRLFERIFSSPIISSKDLNLLKAMLMRFIYAKYIDNDPTDENRTIKKYEGEFADIKDDENLKDGK